MKLYLPLAFIKGSWPNCNTEFATTTPVIWFAKERSKPMLFDPSCVQNYDSIPIERQLQVQTVISELLTQDEALLIKNCLITKFGIEFGPGVEVNLPMFVRRDTENGFVIPYSWQHKGSEKEYLKIPAPINDLPFVAWGYKCMGRTYDKSRAEYHSC